MRKEVNTLQWQHPKLFLTCGTNKVMQHNARSTVRQEKKQIPFTVNGSKNSTCLAMSTENTYLICLGHFEHLLTPCETRKIHDLLYPEIHLATSTLWLSSHLKFHRGWSQHRRCLDNACKNQWNMSCHR